jgi:hypothetical protein
MGGASYRIEGATLDEIHLAILIPSGHECEGFEDGLREKSHTSKVFQCDSGVFDYIVEDRDDFRLDGSLRRRDAKGMEDIRRPCLVELPFVAHSRDSDGPFESPGARVLR